jgi:hypothetical protein
MNIAYRTADCFHFVDPLIACEPFEENCSIEIENVLDYRDNGRPVFLVVVEADWKKSFLQCGRNRKHRFLNGGLPRS